MRGRHTLLGPAKLSLAHMALHASQCKLTQSQYGAAMRRLASLRPAAGCCRVRRRGRAAAQEARVAAAEQRRLLRRRVVFLHDRITSA